MVHFILFQKLEFYGVRFKTLARFKSYLTGQKQKTLVDGELCDFCTLLRFSQTCELLRSKAAFTTTFFAAVNHSYDHKQRTLKHKNTQNGSKSTNHKSQTMTF